MSSSCIIAAISTAIGVVATQASRRPSLAGADPTSCSSTPAALPGRAQDCGGEPARGSGCTLQAIARGSKTPDRAATSLKAGL